MSGLATLRGETTLQQDIKKSRFLARAAPVDTPEAAAAFIARAGDAAATHNCWAWRVGANYRFSDDGEPGGSAGKPILVAIDGQALDRVAVVVTRWYGGIKLGVGGLMRAYGGCAAECLRRAERQPIVDLRRVRIRCDYASLPVLHARLRDFGAAKRAEHADGDGMEIDVELPAERMDALTAWVRDLTRGRGLVERA
ncbi:MAG TPA: YigZ family protein [Dokdonella sp.]|nr:YigZ family protein [Dokdonella sp.]